MPGGPPEEQGEQDRAASSRLVGGPPEPEAVPGPGAKRGQDLVPNTLLRSSRGVDEWMSGLPRKEGAAQKPSSPHRDAKSVHGAPAQHPLDCHVVLHAAFQVCESGDGGLGLLASRLEAEGELGDRAGCRRAKGVVEAAWLKRRG